MELEIPMELCQGPGFLPKIEPKMNNKTGLPEFQFTCLRRANHMLTTIQADRGASGSPVLNDRGQVVGVLYAVTGTLAWSIAVPLEDLKSFLNNM
jgi:S1-C subfamily serine protease